MDSTIILFLINFEVLQWGPSLTPQYAYVLPTIYTMHIEPFRNLMLTANTNPSFNYQYFKYKYIMITLSIVVNISLYISKY